MAFGQLSLKARALRHLARREHSRAELARKLRPHARDEGDASAEQQIGQALDALATLGLLSDERSAQSLLRQRAGHGERRLRQDLQARGLAPELVARTLQQARGSELQRARQLWQRRFGQPPASAAEAARQMRFLAGRGFTAEVVHRVLRLSGSAPDAAVDPDDPDDPDDGGLGGP